ncbi:MAG: aromatic-ring-hydroxylating dioxygenase subunit beta [Pseudomonadota bacterium]
MDHKAAIDLIYLEARLIDEKRLEEWFELYTEDALYWMPLTRNQPEGLGHTSLFYEDKLLLRVRIRRLQDPKAYSQQQASFCQHVLQVPQVEQESNEGLVLRTPFFYMESKLDQQFALSGVCFHTLVRYNGSWHIRQKKIELLNCDAALPSIEMFV